MRSESNRVSRRVPSWLAAVVLALPVAVTAAPATAPPLPAPSGSVVRVTTETQLQAAVAGLASNTTVLIAPGTYRLTRTLHIRGAISNVSLRGESGNRDDVQIVGPGMTNPSYGSAPNGIWTGGGVQGVLIANLTVRDFYFHPIILNAGTALPRIYNVRALDGGEQLLKSNPDSAGKGIDGGIVEYSAFEFSTTSRDYYTNGVDVLGAAGWIIRNNLFKNIRAPYGQLAGPAILMWRGSSNTLVEGNTFINCQRDIALGLEPTTPHDHSGGIIRNNFIYRDATVTNGDAGINVNDSPNTQVLHNTVVISGTYSNAIEYRFPDATGVVVKNNLTDAAIRARDGAVAIVSNNYTTASRSFFVAPALGDLHLTSAATPAIDKGVAGVGVANDWDAEARPAGAAPDIGADEFLSAPNQAPSVTLTPPGSGTTYTAPAAFTLAAAASDPDGTVVRVDFYAGPSLIGSDTSAPYTLPLTGMAAGTYSFTAVAQDNAGARTTSGPVSVMVSSPAPTPITLTATADAFVRGGSYAGRNYGASSQLEVKLDKLVGYTRQSFIRFDLTGVASVSQARVRVFGRMTAAGPAVPVEVFTTDAPWSESTVTWNTKPVASASLGSVSVASASGVWIELDVTAYVKAARAAGKSSMTIMLKGGVQTTAQVLTFSSRESSNRPSLVVMP
jgi:hypothetical protein